MMIEKIVLDYLSGELSVPVCMEVPEEGETYIVIEKTGGGGSNHIGRATLAIQSTAPTLYEAACLNEDVKAAMEMIEVLPEVSESKLNSDYNFTDPTTKKYRYQAVYDLVHY